MNGKCREMNVLYKCEVTTTKAPMKVYLGVTEGEWKTRFYNHTKSITHRIYTNETTLSKYIWDVRDSLDEKPELHWAIVKTVPSYSNVSKRCMLCLHEKLAILNYPKPEELLNKRSELLSKCCHANRFLLSKYKGKD